MLIISALKKILRRIRESGLIYTVQIILTDHVPDKFWRGQKVSIWAFHLSKQAEMNPDVTNIRWADWNDMELLKQAGYSDTDLRSRFSTLCQAAILEDDNKLIAVSWYLPSSQAPWEYHWLRLDLPKNGMWNFDVWVSSAHRGKGIGGQLLSFAHSTLHKSGCEYIHCSIDNLNTSSFRAFQKAHYCKVGEFLFIRVLNFALFRTEKLSECCRMEPGKKFVVPLRHDFASPPKMT